MIPISDNEAAAKACYEIERILLDGAEWELYIGDLLIASIDRSNFEFNIEWGKLIFAWWNEANSQSWRVNAYEIDQIDVRLQATRGMGREMAVLLLRDRERLGRRQELENLGLSERRSRYAELLARLIATEFDGARVRTRSAAQEPTRAFRSRYPRLVVKQADEICLVIGVCAAESHQDLDGIVAAGLVWLASFNEKREDRKQARRLAFCLPKNRSETVIERLTLLNPSRAGARIECLEIDEEQEEISRVRPVTQFELLNAHPREVIWPRSASRDDYWRGRIFRMAPDLIEAQTLPGRDGESFSINGLEFARVIGTATGRVKFGIIGMREGEVRERLVTLTEMSFGDLERLVGEIVKFRSANSPDRRHPFYRLREEAWLESILRRDIRALDAGLDQRHVYSQIPTWRGDQRSVIDLLSINHEGRLVVIEIKATEDAELPMQGLDYWLRVEQARLREEFERRGLFVGVRIADSPPLLYLVAPRLRFHRAFAIVARCLSSQVDAFQVGLNANWRRGIKVHTRERVNLLSAT